MLHIHMQCIHHIYVLICGAQHFFSHLSYCHCRIHLKPISFTAHTFASHSRNVDHKKAVFTFNIFFHPPPAFYMHVSPMVENFFCHFTSQIGKAQNEYGVRDGDGSQKEEAVMGIFNLKNLREEEKWKFMCSCLKMWIWNWFCTFAAVEAQIWKKSWRAFFNMKRNVDGEIHRGWIYIAGISRDGYFRNFKS